MPSVTLKLDELSWRIVGIERLLVSDVMAAVCSRPGVPIPENHCWVYFIWTHGTHNVSVEGIVHFDDTNKHLRTPEWKVSVEVGLSRTIAARLQQERPRREFSVCTDILLLPSNKDAVVDVKGSG